MKQIFSAGVIIFYKKGDELEYLLLHYPSGHWEFPKGKLEENETKEEAAVRELFEETGLKTTIIPGFQDSFIYHFKDFHHEQNEKTVYFFVGEVQNKEVILSHEHHDHVWLSYHDALDRLTYENAKKIFKKAHIFITALP